MDPELPYDVAAWLTSSAGDHVHAATRALERGETALQVGTRLRRDLDPTRAAAVTVAATARVRAHRTGLTDADRLLLTREALEQASRPAVARHRAQRFAEDSVVVDLCSGAGVDAIALGRACGRVLAMDLDASRTLLARHNLAACGIDGHVVVGDAARPPLRLGGLVHADPSRRREGRRAQRLDQYGPPIPALVGATRQARGRGIVVSPAVDWDDPDLPADAEVEFIQVGPDLVEAMLWFGALRQPDVRATATLLPEGVSRSLCRPAAPLPVGEVGEWLVEIAPAAIRARLHDVLGAELGAHRIARARALLSTSTQPVPSPWWTTWSVEAVLPARPREVRRWLRDADPLPLEIATHGLEADLSAWWNALDGPPRGPTGRRLHLVRTDDGALCIVTRFP